MGAPRKGGSGGGVRGVPPERGGLRGGVRGVPPERGGLRGGVRGVPPERGVWKDNPEIWKTFFSSVFPLLNS